MKTELMEMYENLANIETKNTTVIHSVDEIVKLVTAFPEPQPIPVEYVTPLLERLTNLVQENTKLKQQLTWRDASETPDSYARYYCKGYVEYSKGIKQNTKNIFAFDEYGWNFPVGYTLIKWLPIPKEMK